MVLDTQYILNAACFHESIKYQLYENPTYLGVLRWESQNYGTPNSLVNFQKIFIMSLLPYLPLGGKMKRKPCL